MRHRVEAARGRLSVLSRAGSGTRIAAVLPKNMVRGADPLPRMKRPSSEPVSSAYKALARPQPTTTHARY